jgi:hypothetical protein
MSRADGDNAKPFERVDAYLVTNGNEPRPNETGQVRTSARGAMTIRTYRIDDALDSKRVETIIEEDMLRV